MAALPSSTLFALGSISLLSSVKNAGLSGEFLLRSSSDAELTVSTGIGKAGGGGSGARGGGAGGGVGAGGGTASAVGTGATFGVLWQAAAPTITAAAITAKRMDDVFSMAFLSIDR